MENIESLNTQILKITMKIRDQYPELSKYLEEMPDTLSNGNDTKITEQNLSAYYNSLDSLLNKYIMEHSERA
jgi:hypothetical protein